MKRKHLKRLLILPAAAMLLSLVGIKVAKQAVIEDIGPDNALYEAPSVHSYNQLNFESVETTKFAAATVQKVIINYHNDDKDNKNRTFWVWGPNVNGKQYDGVVTNNGADMAVTLDFAGNASELKNNFSISFIVKKKTTWTGQSVDVKVDFKKYTPDNDGLVQIWSLPGEGNDIEVYSNKADSLANRPVFASFTSWNKIHVIASAKKEDGTSDPNAIPTNYKIYAYTSNFYELNSVQQKLRKERYLLRSGTISSTKSVEYNSMPCKEFDLTLNYKAHINVQYMVEIVFKNNPDSWKVKSVAFDKLYSTTRFNQYYTYDGDDLGVTYTPTATTFKVWAPTACSVKVMLYKSGVPTEYTGYEGRVGDDSYGGYKMTFQPGGVWQTTIKDADLNGKYYNYLITNSLGQNEVVDPYAKACNVNGDRGMICDFSKTNPEGWDQINGKWDKKSGYDISYPNELSVYEIHIRDLTMDETWTGKSRRGTYNAFAEAGTTYTESGKTVKTGFDHIEEMGFNAIQILPFYDQDNVEDKDHMSFNWGYNPKNYNCLEGGYSNDPFVGATRVKEFKKLVYAYATNANHTRIIMDVVYNHVSSVPRSSFHKMMPKYFFRYDENGNLYEGSGCGNEFKTNSVMGRKFIVDSLVWWASEYNIKGFRFDLMGLYDIETMYQIKKALYKVDPDIVLYGEGWTGDGSGYSWEEHKPYPVHGGTSADMSAVQYNVYRDSKLTTTTNACWLGAFNDRAREDIGGNNDPGWGFISQGSGDVGQGAWKVFEMFRGNNYNENGGGNPNQIVNYLSCHDDWTLFDKLYVTLSPDGGKTKPQMRDVMNATIAAESSILASNGIAFIHAGEEVFRTKRIDPVADKDYEDRYSAVVYGNEKICHNSHGASDSCNSIKWNRKIAVDGVDSTRYVDIFKAAVKAHTQMPKYAFDKNFNNSNMHCWAGVNEFKDNEDIKTLSTTIVGLQCGSYFVVFNGRNTSGTIRTGSDLYNIRNSIVVNTHSTSGATAQTDISWASAGSDYKLTLKAYQLVIFKK